MKHLESKKYKPPTPPNYQPLLPTPPRLLKTHLVGCNGHVTEQPLCLQLPLHSVWGMTICIKRKVQY